MKQKEVILAINLNEGIFAIAIGAYALIFPDSWPIALIIWGVYMVGYSAYKAYRLYKDEEKLRYRNKDGSYKVRK
jgi:hypothetical protein